MAEARKTIDAFRKQHGIEASKVGGCALQTRWLLQAAHNRGVQLPDCNLKSRTLRLARELAALYRRCSPQGERKDEAGEDSEVPFAVEAAQLTGSDGPVVVALRDVAWSLAQEVGTASPVRFVMTPHPRNPRCRVPWPARLQDLCLSVIRSTAWP